ncbi:MAG: UDP-N-acetylmuramoyl-L-alanyl-D-glutamate--2,6-diaminopimelate ligase [Pseudomonadota bacterium]
MNLAALLPGGPDVTVTGMTLDSRQVTPGDLFVALAGHRAHGLRYAAQAIERGCAAVLWEEGPDVPAPSLPVPGVGVADLSAKLSRLAGEYYGHPSRELTLVGVTGTNGKSSCVEFLGQAWQQLGHAAGTLGTLGSGLVGQPRQDLGLTTSDAITVQRELRRLRELGCTHVAMEVSSHALTQHRVAALDFEVAVVTNISRDHLDYHGSMAAYVAAKARLLSDFSPRAAILNADDDAFETMQQSIDTAHTELITFGFASAQVVARQLTLSAAGCRFDLEAEGLTFPVTSPLVGEFNVANVLAVAAAIKALEPQAFADPDALTLLLGGLMAPAGRMEKVPGIGGPLVVVDYAHTPDALENALKALRHHCAGQLICVFGCGGDRDAGKRPLMGAAAARLADQVVVTSDNPRGEAPERIIDDILAGIEDVSRVRRIADRRKAIAAALNLAAANDAVLVAGKGHETYQETATGRVEFDDRAVAAELLEACA